MKELKTRVAVVVSAHLAARGDKKHPHGDENKLVSIRRTVACHRHYNPGVSYTLIIVDNASEGAGVSELVVLGDRYLRNPDNYGYGFAGWKFAWETYKDEFDYYLFTEDDWAPSKDGWLTEIVEKFLSDSSVGMCGNFRELHAKNNTNFYTTAWEIMNLGDADSVESLDGGWAFTSTKILQRVDAAGGLMVFPTSIPANSNGTINELAFPYPVIKLGYRLYSFAQNDYYHIHGSELQTGRTTSDACEKVAPLLPHGAERANPRVRQIFSWLFEDGIIKNH